ncbi:MULTISPECIES: long-chain-fatty-acid--CoA ligase [Micrococcaceae]|uniref:long-chain-fatty-acid--CoA ligase n=1 Tax=Micrococcaceae TaxID=1268 RepID=UPI001D0019C9|nr:MULTISPECIES: long-chain-fatty-acid--CoA ligase [Micrococcaceae]MCB5280452.1 Long-chain-fatty-acid--CoA ligase [Arthrobacter sp. ES1]MDJ0351834.1 long-chain-fatty-acid--CoA ligase [Pseudarthrobacter sp. PH31-O2]WGZ81041.1 long-chain-fatty-acid--CoA ligase [Arthrobacter sp. EM1]
MKKTSTSSSSTGPASADTAREHGQPWSERPWTRAYGPGVPSRLALPKGSLVDLLDKSVRRYGSKTALEFFGARTSYRELGTLISRAAAGLEKLGVKAGDRVALVLPNCPQHIIAFHAVLRLGAVVVEHNPLYTDRELRHQFEDHGAVVAIVWDKAVERVRQLPADVGLRSIVSVELIPAMPLLQRLALRLPVPAARKARAALSVGSKQPKARPVAAPRTVLPWRDLLDAGRLKKNHPRPAPRDVAVLQYTSGTTGLPKAAMLSHANLQANAAQGRAWVPGLKDGRETVYAVLPMFHAYGLTLCMTFALSIGAKLVLFPKFDVDLVFKALKKSPATFLPAVPPIYDRIAAAAAERGVGLGSIRFAISGAMNLPTATVETWEKATGGYLIEGYGLTETSPIAIGNPFGASRKPGTVGVPFPLTDIRVVDPRNVALDRAAGEEGELLIRGPQVFAGYWNRPVETEEALLDGGWFRTGDIVSVDEDYFVTIRDRIKELIITGGFNVSPSEVEDVMATFPGVAEVCVVGLPRAGGGEDVVAAVVPAAGTSINTDSLLVFARKHLTAYKVPRRVVVLETLPRSLIGKVLRREIRDTLAAVR